MNNNEFALPNELKENILVYFEPVQKTKNTVMQWGRQLKMMSLVNQDFCTLASQILPNAIKTNEIIDACDRLVPQVKDDLGLLPFVKSEINPNHMNPELLIAINYAYPSFVPARTMTIDLHEIIKFIPNSLNFRSGEFSVLTEAVISLSVPTKIIKILLENEADIKEEYALSSSSGETLQALEAVTKYPWGQFQEPDPNHPHNIRYHQIIQLFKKMTP